MIVDYGFSLIGKSHVVRGICCQDNHKIKRLENGWYIAAIADGVGSAKNAQIGARIAVETVVTVCEEFMPWDYNLISIKSMMRTAYNYAFKQILREARKAGEPVESYDTTLTMVIYDGNRIIYGHSGDGAIIGLNVFGDYVPITKPQKGPDGVSVIPLRAGYTAWKIDAYEEELAAVLLMTDGMLDIFCPYLLRDNEHREEKVYVPLATFFADPICFSGDEKQIENVKKSIELFLAGDEGLDAEIYYRILEKAYKKRLGDTADKILDELKIYNYPIVLMQGVQDDKTMVGLINTETVVDNREESFYKEPDWQRLQDSWNRKAYPHLYARETGDNEVQSNETICKDNAVAEQAETGLKAANTRDIVKPDNNPSTLYRQPDSDKARQALEAYGKTTRAEASKIINSAGTQGIGNTADETRAEGKMEKHEKPRKKSVFEKFGNFWEK